MARPTPKDDARRALFGWLTDKPVDRWAPATETDLPETVQSLIAYRGADTAEAQTLIAGDLQVRSDLLADATKGPLVWKAIARQMGPQALRMNLNRLLRHDVFKKHGLLGFAGTDNARNTKKVRYEWHCPRRFCVISPDFLGTCAALRDAVHRVSITKISFDSLRIWSLA
jgi:hypothetical protein